MIFTYRIYILAFLLSLSTIMNAHVNVLYPVGGESFITGYIVTIEWEIAQPHELLDWDVYYSPDTGDTWIPLAIDLPPATLNLDWVVPSDVTDLGLIRVYMNNVGDDYIDYSGVFSIEPNTSPPFFDVEAQNITIPCNVSNQQAAIQAWLASHGEASVINYCGDLTWTNDYFLSNDCGATGDALVTFTATDDCGSTETAALLVVEDAIPPTFVTPPVNSTVESDGHGNTAQLNNWLNSKGGATATDGCGSITWTNNFTVFNTTCGHAGSTTVIFTAHDECGNTSSAAATFTITDQVGPTLIQPAQTLTIDAGPNTDSLLQNWLGIHGGAIAIDPEGVVNWQHNFISLSDGCGITGNATVTFNASDVCGNSVSTIATVQVIDQTPPSFNIQAVDKAVTCSDTNSQLMLQQWLNSNGGASAVDFGGVVVWQNNYSGLSDSCGITGSAVVTFTAIDPCGNSAVTTGTFQTTDLVAPVIQSGALDTTVYCPQLDINNVMQQWLSRHGGARATDLCGTVNWTHDFSAVLDSCQIQASYPVTFTVWDECLNSTLTSATFTVIDTISEDTTITSVLNSLNMEFKVFPNPVDDLLTVEWENYESIPVQLSLLDASGRYVWSAQSTSDRMVIPVDHYSAGVYFLSCKKKASAGMRMVIIE